jgi:hypothetical protein
VQINRFSLSSARQSPPDSTTRQQPPARPHLSIYSHYHKIYNFFKSPPPASPSVSQSVPEPAPPGNAKLLSDFLLFVVFNKYSTPSQAFSPWFSHQKIRHTSSVNKKILSSSPSDLFHYVLHQSINLIHLFLSSPHHSQVAKVSTMRLELIITLFASCLATTALAAPTNVRNKNSNSPAFRRTHRRGCSDEDSYIKRRHDDEDTRKFLFFILVSSQL